MKNQLFEDLFHVYHNFTQPALSENRLQELVDLGWLWHDTSVEVAYWEVTSRGWRVLEQAEFVAKPYGR